MIEAQAPTAGESNFVLALLIAGWSILYFSTYERLASTLWKTDEQGHGPIILALVAYLLFRKRAILSRYTEPANGSGGIVLVAGLLAFIFGHALSISIVDVGSQIVVLCGLFLIFKGRQGLRLVAFPILFLAFMIPLPAALVGTVTSPLKIIVSSAAASVLYDVGYPVGRSGVTITIGQYELLVADACAGLNSMFTLEALGFLYMNVMGYSSRLRNVLLAVSIIPIAFVANVSRVIAIILTTYYFGDEVGQGLVHGFAGMLLFSVALALILFVDSLFGRAIVRHDAKLPESR